ncbi:MAG: cell division protein FtsQ/DivIB [Gemmatimonadaceae bacterium]
MSVGGDGAVAAEGRAPRRRWWRLAVVALALAALAGAPWWGPRALASLAFFRVRKVEVEGVRYLAPADVVAGLRVDTAASVWDDVAPLERRLAALPQVASVEVSRKLPATLVVRVRENLPVALVPGAGGALRAVDAAGRVLPIEPSRVGVDVPIVGQRDASRDTALLRLLGDVRDEDPRFFARISEARRLGRGELLLQLMAPADVAPTAAGASPAGALPVRAMADVTVGRLTEIYPVEENLARRGLRAAEIDLRYRDQVIARLQ